MSKTSTARHRKAARPLNSLVGASPMVRRSLAVAASSGLARLARGVLLGVWVGQGRGLLLALSAGLARGRFCA